MPNLPPRNKTLVIAAKFYGETDIKAFWSFPFLFGISLSHLFSAAVHLRLPIYIAMTNIYMGPCLYRYLHKSYM